MMWAGSYYSLFIIAKNLHNPKKIAETSNNEILMELQKIHAVQLPLAIMHYNEILSHYQKSMWVETGI